MSTAPPNAAVPPAPPAPPAPSAPPVLRLGLLWVLIAGVLVYANSLRAPFVLDDLQIVDSPAVASLRAPVDWLAIESRPVTLVTLRLNHALDRALGGSGLRPPIYHATNILIHLAVAAAIYHLVLLSHRRSAGAPGSAEGVALAVALLWVVHPLTTQAVTYTIQRSEALASLGILLALYAVARGAAANGGRARAWYGLAVGACWFGLLSKQVAVVAPVLVLLYDRAFLAGGFAPALRRRWGVYLLLLTPLAPPLAAALADLALGLAPAPPPAPASPVAAQASAGFDLAKHSAAEYAMTQPRSILHYLRLAVLPHPLVFDYGWSVFTSWTRAWPWVLGLVPFLAAAGVCLVRAPRVGFIAAAFFIVLAPSSSVLPIADVVYEYRAYLALAAILTLLVLAGAWLAERAPPGGRRVGPGLVVAAAVALGGVTMLRNLDYASAERLWLDTASKAPANPRAHHNLANVYLEQGRLAEAVPAFTRALRLEPRNALARTNLAVALRGLGRAGAARAELAAALRHYPSFPPALYQMGVTERVLGRPGEAERWLERATAADPGLAAAWLDLGTLRYEAGRRAGAVDAWRRAADLGVRSPAVFNNLGLAAAQDGDLAAAARWWRASLDLDPHQSDTRANLDRAQAMLRSPDAAGGR